ncbi:MAG TPA: hypothetical protein VHY08_06220 [Bacillota bacterium]|nr:hypothetical protein [Bacillota bacterium]
MILSDFFDFARVSINDFSFLADNKGNYPEHNFQLAGIQPSVQITSNINILITAVINEKACKKIRNII